MRDVLAEIDPIRTTTYVNRIEELQQELDVIYQNLNLPFQKMAKAKRHFESNRCTKYYFQEFGRNNQSVKCLSEPDGSTTTDNKRILTKCKEYYENLYRQPYLFKDCKHRDKYLSLIPRNLLSDQGFALLDKQISIQELHDSLLTMRKDAVPGDDGLTVKFYIKYWDLVKDLFFDSLQFAFENEKLSISQRRGLIKLIPKKDKDPLLVPSWRPITLLNVDYKMLTKLFSCRLAVFLPDLIHPDQKGFIKGRNIHDNLLDIQALISICEESDSEAMFLLLDIHKAFDSIGWEFLFSVLTQYGFPDSFIRWFNIFYSYKELRILNQGYMSDVIFPERGVAQGCGISPLFFILGIEVLAIAIREDPRIQGINMNNVSKKINLLADDGILALKWTESTLFAVKEVLSEFASVSNLMLNPNKSLIVPLGPGGLQRNFLPNASMFPHALDGQFRYLGVSWC